jgi:osmoprotectant transport system permease protein
VTPLAQSCLAANSWICGQYYSSRSSELLDALQQHVVLTLMSVVAGLILAFPLALAAHRVRQVRGPILGLTTAIYAVPSLALFPLLLPMFGLTATTVVAGLTLYSLTILVRNIMAGLAGVPEEVRESARGMGYGPVRMLFAVELPIAIPAIMAGLRVATVSTVALLTIGGLVGYGGLGTLILQGLPSLFKAQVLTASVLCVLLAVLADLVLVAIERVITPWRRRAA